MFSLCDNRRWLSLSSKTTLNVAKRFEEPGSVQNRNMGKSGRRSRMDAATVDAVASAVQHAERNTSVKRVSGQLRLSRSTTYRIMRSLLHWLQPSRIHARWSGSTHFLRDTFTEQRLISRKAIIDWPTKSPYLNPCDFFLWRYLKDWVYRDLVPQTLDQLERNITRETRKIDAALVEKVMKEFSD